MFSSFCSCHKKINMLKLIIPVHSPRKTTLPDGTKVKQQQFNRGFCSLIGPVEESEVEKTIEALRAEENNPNVEYLSIDCVVFS